MSFTAKLDLFSHIINTGYNVSFLHVHSDAMICCEDKGSEKDGFKGELTVSVVRNMHCMCHLLSLVLLGLQIQIRIFTARKRKHQIRVCMLGKHPLRLPFFLHEYHISTVQTGLEIVTQVSAERCNNNMSSSFQSGEPPLG